MGEIVSELRMAPHTDWLATMIDRAYARWGWFRRYLAWHCAHVGRCRMVWTTGAFLTGVGLCMALWAVTGYGAGAAWLVWWLG